jgi:cytochrome P450 family 6
LINFSITNKQTINSLCDKNAEFYRMGTKSFESLSIIKRIMLSNNKNVARKLHVKFLPEDISSFYMNVVRETVEYREKNKIVRNDFMNLLIQLKNSKSDDAITFNQVAAQCFVFFLAG